MVKPMRWGFIGASNIAERVIPALRKVPGQEPMAVCSRNAERARQFATTQGLQASYTDLGAFLREGRFDAVYVGHFKCNLRRIVDYPNLREFTREIYQLPGVRETVHMDHIKGHYYQSHASINPPGIIPVGPQLDLDVPHRRG